MALKLTMRLVSLLVAASVSASGQTAEEIVRKAADAYRSLKSYHFEAQVVNEGEVENTYSRTRTTVIVAAAEPSLRRIEIKGGTRETSYRIYDGDAVWDYRQATNQFAHFDQPSYTPRPSLLSDPVDTYRVLGESAAHARVLREEAVEAAGGKRPCWVVEIPPQAPARPLVLERSATYWIDKSTYLVLKDLIYSKFSRPNTNITQTETITSTYTMASINEPVSAELFQFEPPSGATEVADFPRPVGAGQPLPNTPSPDFTLQGFDGKEMAWSSLKGKPVLVDFWATWCVPCRAEMPKIQEIQRLFGDKNLTVLAIDIGEKPEVARKYIQESGYTFRVLLDPDESVKKKFKVAGIPALFLIDREGNLHSVYGSRLDLLKEELKKIGVQ